MAQNNSGYSDVKVMVSVQTEGRADENGNTEMFECRFVTTLSRAKLIVAFARSNGRVAEYKHSFSGLRCSTQAQINLCAVQMRQMGFTLDLSK